MRDLSIVSSFTGAPALILRMISLIGKHLQGQNSLCARLLPFDIRPLMWTVAALYRFVALANLPALQKRVKDACLENDICGTLLLAPEGINGTMAGPASGIDRILEMLDQETGIRQGEIKFSTAEEKPFRRMKVRLKQEIITMKAPEADPTRQAGEYIEAKDW